MISTKTDTYLDFDDTMFDSKECFVKTYNQYYNKNGKIEDLKLWSFKCIYPDITIDQLWYIFTSKEFFENLTIKKYCKEVLLDNSKDYTYKICTIGVEKSLQLKKEFLIEKYNDIFKGFEVNKFFGINTSDSVDKGSIDMGGCLQVDDRIDSLTSTNSKVKMLIKEEDYEWNDEINAQDIYRVSNWNDIDSIFKFYKSIGKVI